MNISYHPSSSSSKRTNKRTSSSISAAAAASVVEPVTALQLWKRSKQMDNHHYAHDNTIGTHDHCDYKSMASVIAPIVPLLLFAGHHQHQQQLQHYPPSDHNNDSNNWLRLGTFGTPGTITEISGKAGTGKTQLCLSICLSTVLLPITMTTKSTMPVQDKDSINNKRTLQECHGMIDAIKDDANIHIYQRQRTNSNAICNPHLKESQDSKSTRTRTGSIHPNQMAHDRNENADTSANVISKQAATVATMARTRTLQNEYNEALYISMNETSSSSQIAHRIHQMTSTRLRSQPPQQQQQQQQNDFCDMNSNASADHSPNPQHIKGIMQRIHTRFLRNQEEFMDLLDSLPSILQNGTNTNASGSSSCRKRIKLIVLDSMAGMYRTPDEQDSRGSGSGRGLEANYYRIRSEGFFKICARLKEMAGKFGVNVIVVNQVTDIGNSVSVPSLGLSWSCCVNERYGLSRKEVNEHGSSGCGVVNSDDSKSAKTGNGIGGTRFERRIEMLASSRWKEGKSTKFRIENIGAVLAV